MEQLGYFDEITADDLKAMAEANGPKVTIFLPTAPPQHQPKDTATRVKSLVNEARRKLINAGVPESDAKDMLAPFDAIATDAPFLRQQGESLALFAARGLNLIFRLGVPVTEYTHVAEHFVLRPIAEALTKSHAYYILAVSRNKVRLLDATKDSVVRLDLKDIVPESLEDVVDTDDRQAQLQNRNMGAGGAVFHGQGGASDIQESENQRFLHEVGSSLGDLLGRARSQPLVLAGVAENVSAIKASSSYPVVAEDFIPGNPDTLTPRELQQSGWDVVRPRFAANDDAAYDRFADVSGTGLGETQPDLIREAAVAGRVDTLFINPSLSASDGTGDVNTAILHTKLNSGDIVIISDGRVEDVAALMRY
ncbi:MAG TPA: hypothetical protein VIG71_01295 [Enteractinococcus sp.]